VRLLATSSTNKNDPNDARSVAVTALRSPEPQEVRREDHAAVMKIWAKRRRELVSARTQTVCRLHAVLCELVPGGISGQLYATKAANMLDEFEPDTAVNAARHDLGLELLADLRRIDEQLRETKQRIAQAVAASKTTLTELYGVGPIVAAMVIGYVGDVTRFASSDRFAAYNGTAPIEVSSGPRTIHRLSRRGNRRLNHAIHMAAVTQIRNLDSQGRAYYDRKIAEGKSGKEALRALKRRISDAIFRQLLIDAERARATAMGPGGQAGNGSKASVTDSHPEGRLFGEATPEPETTLRPAARAVRSKGAKTPARSARKAS
jgi:transposase